MGAPAFRLLAALLIPILAGCTRDPGVTEGSTAPWDTSFQVAGIPFPSDSILDRSVVARGQAGRLESFYRKCERGGEVRIGFIGGSITEGASATRAPARFSTRLLVFLGKRYPSARFVEINAGIGATNSRFGASRVEGDLLSRDPDLVIVDFAVNDDHAAPDLTAETLEGLVRKCLAASDAPVVLFQTMDAPGRDGNHAVQARLAAHYGLPVVGYHAALRPLVRSGQLPWDRIAVDEYHPNNTGHLVAAYLLYAFLDPSRPTGAIGKAGVPGAAPASALPDPMASAFYAAAGIYGDGHPAIRLDSLGGWTAHPDGAGRVGFRSGGAGNRLAFTTTAREVTFLYRFAKDLDARVEVAVDGVPQAVLGNHFAEDWGGGFLKPYRVFRADSAAVRTVTLTGVSGGMFDLRYILTVE